MLAQIPDDLLKVIPEKWMTVAMAAYLGITVAGRAYHAIASGGGIKGIWNALVFGTNTPKQPNQINETPK